jgi:KaiC/GvpD/RAD55 family RecA-like ATPase
MERDTFIKTLEKRYAKGIVVNGNSIIEEPKTIIPVSPSLDLLFGGGVAEGSWFNLSGFSGVGKTSTALDFAATCQLEEYGHGKSRWVQSERCRRFVLVV